EACWRTAGENIAENPLHAMLVKILVLAKRHQVLQQARVVNGPTTVVNGYTRPVRLTGHRAVGFQQVTVELFANVTFTDDEMLCMRFEMLAFDIHSIKAISRHAGNAPRGIIINTEDRHLHSRTKPLTEIFFQH